ncbi:unnamed protein product [Closterium sp. Yama58-4]|nr:unnamed protein product [Closterium sp. Yama58-4]
MGRRRGRAGECGGETKRACRLRLFENTSQAIRDTRMTWRGGRWRTTMMTCAAAPCSDGGPGEAAPCSDGGPGEAAPCSDGGPGEAAPYSDGGAAPRAELAEQRRGPNAELRLGLGTELRAAPFFINNFMALLYCYYCAISTAQSVHYALNT